VLSHSARCATRVHVCGREALVGCAIVIPAVVGAAGLSLLLWGSSEGQGIAKGAGTPSPHADNLRQRLAALWASLRQPSSTRCVALLAVMGAAPKPTAALFYAYTQPRAEGGLGLSPLGVGQLRAGGALARAAGLALHGAALTTSRPARIIGPAAWAGAALASLQTAALSPAAARLLLPALQMGVTVGSSLALAAVVRVSGIAALGAAAELSSAASGMESCVFCLLMTAWNASHIGGSALGSLLMWMCRISTADLSMLPTMLAVCSLSLLAPLAVLRPSTSIPRPFVAGGMNKAHQS